ncbi:MAG: hypothetical protein V3S14_15465, partial [Anaerolineae bacterium]
LLLGISTERGMSGCSMFGPLFTNVFKLTISVWVLLAGPLFHVGSQAVVVLLEQPTNHWLTGSVTSLIETLFNINQTTVEPLSVTHWIACSVRRHDVQQDHL